ncbi:MAG: MFS transporter [Promethearchaeota archaeon]
MSENRENLGNTTAASSASAEEFRVKTALTYSAANFSDVLSYQFFTFYIFTFYFSVMKLDVNLITVAFIAWSVWNSLNDPLLGAISDRTMTRWGRRRPYMMVALVPLGIMVFLLFSPPGQPGAGGASTFAYFVVMIMVFEGFYTMYSLNLTSSFPEIFLKPEARFKANNVRQIMAILALIVATLVPTMIIPDLTDAQYYPKYQLVGALVGVMVVVGGLVFLKWGPRERPEFSKDYEKSPGLVESIKTCVRSKSFRRYIPAEIANWFVYGLLPTIIPLYAKFVLGVEGIMTGLLLGMAFICGAGFMSLWKAVVRRLGPRKTWMISMSTWIATLVPTLFISDVVGGLVTFALMGLGLSGSLYIIDLIVADIIDEDEVATGIRREASYYGVNALFLRFSTIFVFLAISLVFNSVGWTIFEPESVTPEILMGLRVLMFVFPVIALAIAIVAVYTYPLDGERRAKMREKLVKIHAEKQDAGNQ